MYSFALSAKLTEWICSIGGVAGNIAMSVELVEYPADLDDHIRLYGMRADEFRYTNETCPTCDNRIDELGWCGHGNIGGD